MQIQVPLADLDYSESETNAVIDVLKGRWLTMGAVTKEFERQFSEYLGAKHAIAVTNGTVALHMACLSLGIGPGDEVIIPALTFVATANAVLYTGARLCFADIISADELTISPAEIDRLITPRTKAVIVMHYAGYPCNMPEIMDIAKRAGIAVIEDSAHAPGASIQTRAMGTWGEVGCFSFFSNKNLATGEGGMLVTNRDDLANKMRLQRSHGMTSLTWDRHQGHAYSYDVIDLGYNYRIDELHAALGLVQLEKLNVNNLRRAQITSQYRHAFQHLELKMPFQEIAESESIAPAYHIFPILLPEDLNRVTFMDSLRKVGVQTSIHYPPIHKFSYHQQRYPGVALPITESIAAREVTLPLYPSMREQDILTVIDSVKMALNQS
jgi:dTDP-4-amino-4,6-dideoxygalactose transaminase